MMYSVRRVNLIITKIEDRGRERMRFVSLSSGSSGNSTYIGSVGTHILIDAGCSRKRIIDGLNSLDIDLPDINGIFITHEHSDHIAALRLILKKYDIPVYATQGTIQGIREADKNGEMLDKEFHVIRSDEPVILGDITINPMRISHDAREPVGFRIACEGRKCAVATDLGSYDDYIVGCLQDMDALLLEANHDVRMLQTGPYPYQLKMRIAGNQGHLSNDMSGELLCKLLNDHMKGIVLGHLSDKNNLPELAYETVRLAIDMGDNPYHSSDIPLYVAKRSEVSQVIEI